MERERRLGRIRPNMKDNGVMAWLRDRGHFIMQMGMFIKAILLEIELMGMEFTSMRMDNDMKENGLMICKKVKVLKN